MRHYAERSRLRRYRRIQRQIQKIKRSNGFGRHLRPKQIQFRVGFMTNTTWDHYPFDGSVVSKALGHYTY
jgi:hypothetical protein